MKKTRLIESAKKAMQNAYAPYSKFQVGAALLTKDGQVFTGCNVENSSYGATICAERTAIVKAISEGYREFESLAIVSMPNEYTYPCGICRQMISEFMPNGTIILEDKTEGIKECMVKDLIPNAFLL